MNPGAVKPCPQCSQRTDLVAGPVLQLVAPGAMKDRNYIVCWKCNIAALASRREPVWKALPSKTKKLSRHEMPFPAPEYSR